MSTKESKLISLWMGVAAAGLGIVAAGLGLATWKQDATTWIVVLVGAVVLGLGVALSRRWASAGGWTAASGAAVLLGGQVPLLGAVVTLPRIWHQGLFVFTAGLVVPAAAAVAVWALARGERWPRAGGITGAVVSLVLLAAFLVPQSHLAPRIHDRDLPSPATVMAGEPSETLVLADVRKGRMEPVGVELLRQETGPAILAWRAHLGSVRSIGLVKASEGKFFPLGIVPESMDDRPLQKRIEHWHLATKVLGPLAFWVWVFVLLTVVAGTVALFVRRHALARAAGWAAAGLMAYVPAANLVLLVVGWTSGAFHTPVAAALACLAADLASLAALVFLARAPRSAEAR